MPEETKKFDVLFDADHERVVRGTAVHRIVALRDIQMYDVKKGDLGGFVKSEYNLSQEGSCWISGDACVCGDAVISDDAHVADNARVYGRAIMCGKASIRDNGHLSGRAGLYGNSCVCGKATVYEEARIFCDAIISGSAAVSGKARVSDKAVVTDYAVCTDMALVSDRSVVCATAVLRDAVHVVDSMLVRRSSDLFFFTVRDKPVNGTFTVHITTGTFSFNGIRYDVSTFYETIKEIYKAACETMSTEDALFFQGMQFTLTALCNRKTDK